MLKTIWGQIRKKVLKRRRSRFEKSLPQKLAEAQLALKEALKSRSHRMLVIKQDVNEDLYCCPPDSSTSELILSTLLRTGPVALFTELNADFRIVETVDDPECQIWQERATVLKWDSLEFFASYREQIPERDYGQKRWAMPLDEIDWNHYDIVISMDVCVPERITRKHRKTLWCYYVREIKASSYAASLEKAAPGQDVVLNHKFRLHPTNNRSHVLEFPYHLQRPGCFHRLFGLDPPDTTDRRGVFVDHHTMVQLTSEQRNALGEFGPVASTIHVGTREIIPTSEQLARRTMDDDLRERLLNSRYFLITPGQRRVFGTALIEAIAAGCLAIGSPDAFGDHGYIFNHATAASDFAEALQKMRQLEKIGDAYVREVSRQRTLIDYACFVRPLGDLLNAWDLKRSQLVNPRKAE